MTKRSRSTTHGEEAGLRRLRLGAMRRLSPELLMVAKTQRWRPEELLRTLIEAEIASRDASNTRARMAAAAFPVTKTLDEFDVAASSVPQATFDYLAGLEWVTAKGNVCLVGPAGTGKSHLLVGLGHRAIEAGHRVRYFTAAELVETLYRGLADNSVGRVIEGILKADLILIDEIGFAPMDHTGANSSSDSSPAPTNAGPSGSGHTGPSRNGDGSSPNTPPPSASSTGSSTTPSSSPPKESHSGCAKPARNDQPPRLHTVENLAEERGLLMATSGDRKLATDTVLRSTATVTDRVLDRVFCSVPRPDLGHVRQRDVRLGYFLGSGHDPSCRLRRPAAGAARDVPFRALAGRAGAVIRARYSLPCR